MKKLLIILIICLSIQLSSQNPFANAKWITMDSLISPSKNLLRNPSDSVQTIHGSVLFRKAFETKEVVSASINVTGLGYYELSINGKKIGNDVLQPSKTNYNKRVLWTQYNVTEAITEGENVLGIEVGNGWYNPQKKYWSINMPWFGYPKTICKLILEYSDGSRDSIMTDNTWKSSFGAIKANCIYDGEVYDANGLEKGWNASGFNDDHWLSVQVLPEYKGNYVHDIEGERVVQTLTTDTVYNQPFGIKVYDFGQNFSGWTKIKVKGEQGAKVMIRHAEMLDRHHMLDVHSLNNARNTDVYILSGDGEEVYHPKFTYHGFRYAEITIEGNAELIDIEAQVVHNDIEQIGIIETDNELINHIHHCTQWSQKSILHGVPVDCPQRNERLGWMGDVHIALDQSLWNYDLKDFYLKWLEDIRLEQKENGRLPHIAPNTGNSGTPVWSSAYPMLIWKLYEVYQDTSILEKYYASSNQYIEYLKSSAKDHIIRQDKFGDWANLGQDIYGSVRLSKPNMNYSDSLVQWERGQPKSLSTAFYYHDIMLQKQMAEVLGNDKDVEELNHLAKEVKASYNKNFYNEQSGAYESDAFTFQTAQAIALKFDLCKDEYQKQLVLNSLIQNIENNDYAFSSGIIGTYYIIEVMSDHRRSDIAYKMLNKKTYPSYATMLKGQTTIPEHWNRKGSMNHIMFGSVDAWFYEVLGGLSLDKINEKIIQLKPYFPNDMASFKANSKCVYGRIRVEWKKEGEKVELLVEVPDNCQLELSLEGQYKLKTRVSRKDQVFRDKTRILMNGGIYTLELELGKGKGKL